MQAVAYEAMLLVDAAFTSEQIQAVIEKYTGIITENGGVVDDIDRWDPRRLAYEIKRKREGIYIVVNFVATPAARDELHRIIGISDDVLRAMIVRQDPKADRYPSRVRMAELERREREMAARASITASPGTAEPVTDLSAPTTVGGVSGGEGAAEESAAPEETTAAPEPAADDAPAAPAEPDTTENPA
ncbi:MAG: hypothetical protein OHK0029_03440 [Armatimonadaceae bacterium]